ncbi:hypothetical protein CK203_090184 [Vitis vinifera]|uniref:Uncharacterized protein n=1 Tax=Vitis vinifera TaxID=29760 RepID=A0A438CN82_VITVI|nr:hypothetical protein CK203_090184 [Vitis vinifera]
MTTIKKSQLFLRLILLNSPPHCRGKGRVTEELAVGRDDGRSDFGPGRSRVGGIYGSGPGKPKKGRAAPRDPKRIRHSSELDLDYEDDPDMM